MVCKSHNPTFLNCCLFWAKVHKNGLRQSGKLFCGQLNWKLKRRGTISCVIGAQSSENMGRGGCISAYGFDKDSYPDCIFSWKGLSIFQEDSAKPHTAPITTLWLRNRRTELSKRFNWEHLEPRETKKNPVCWTTRILYQSRIGQLSSPKTPAAAFLSSDIYRLSQFLGKCCCQ